MGENAGSALRKSVAIIFMCGSVAGCVSSPENMPLPTMVGDQRAYSMMGEMATDDPEKVRAKVIKLMGQVCPSGVKLVQFRAIPIPRYIKEFHYEAVGTCDTE